VITRWSIAHERLQQQLTVRTHRQPPPAPAPKTSAVPVNRDARRVRINGRTYGSITAACRRYSCSPRRIYDWIESGRAQFV